jgi:hypothetical protein
MSEVSRALVAVTNQIANKVLRRRFTWTSTTDGVDLHCLFADCTEQIHARPHEIVKFAGEHWRKHFPNAACPHVEGWGDLCCVLCYPPPPPVPDEVAIEQFTIEVRPPQPGETYWLNDWVVCEPDFHPMWKAPVQVERDD